MSSATPSMTIVIVSYRTAALVIDSLAIIAEERERTPEVRVDVLVVDNASGDAPALSAAIRERRWQDWATLLVSERNGGFAYGNNVAFRYAYEHGAISEYFFLLNPDAELRRGAIRALVRFLESEPRAGVVGTSLEDETGAPWPYAYRFPSVWSELNHGMGMRAVSKLLQHRMTLRRMGSQPAEVDWFPGAAMVVRREVIEQLGGLDEGYFLYYEETDFCLKAKRAGWSVWYVPEARVMHREGCSTGRRGQPARLPDYWFDSRNRYFLKNFGKGYALATNGASLVANALGLLKNSVLHRDGGQPPYLLRDLLRHALDPLYARSDLTPQEYRPARSDS